MEYAIIAPNHLKDYRSAGSFIHLLNDQTHESPDDKVVASSDPSSPILILPHKFYDSSGTYNQAATFLENTKEAVEGQEICIRLEGATLSEQVIFLASLELDFVDSIMIPPYNNFDDRKVLIEAASGVKVRILEVPVRCEEQISFFKEHRILSVSTSLPVRLGCKLRDIGEGPEPDSKLEDLDDLQPKWTQRVVQKFVDLCQS